jgi:retinol dehydrogenase-12
MSIPALIASTIYSQLIFKVPPVEASLEGKTYIVTGANIGLGLEAARNLARLNASKVILAVRSVEKGEEAKASILESTWRSEDAVEVWPLCLLSTASVKEFAARVNGLERVDGVILSAAIVTETFELIEGEEKTIKTNVISNTLLSLLLLPKLRESAAKFSIEPTLTLVVSSMHEMAKFEERKEADIFAALRNAKRSKMEDRYGALSSSLHFCST